MNPFLAVCSHWVLGNPSIAVGRKSRPKGRGSYPRTATDQAVINFLNRWRTGKQRFEQLTARQQALRASLEGSVLEDSRAGSTVQQLSILPEPSQEPADGQDR